MLSSGTQTSRVASTPVVEAKVLKYFIFTSGNRTHNRSRLQGFQCSGIGKDLIM